MLQIRRRRSLSLYFLSPLLITAVAGCGGGNDENIENLFSVATQGTADRCAFFGRYNDQVCDTDCPLPDPDCDSGDIRNIDGEGPTMCVALRGNGDRIPAHFAGMARITENYGLVSGVAGGSSAAFSAMLIESVQKNSSVRCQHCSAREKGERAAVLFKSMFGYINTISSGEDFLAAQSYAALLSEIESSGLDQQLSDGSPQAAQQLLVLLNSDRFRSLINPEIFQLLRQSPDPDFHAADLYQGMQSAAAFDPSDPNILVRPGLLNIDGLAEQIGLAADFYVESDLSRFVASCADHSVGKSWTEITTLETENGNCGSLFQTPLNQYLQRRTPSSQLNQKVGDFMHTLIPTSVIEGESVNVWKEAFAAYKQAAPVTMQYDFNDIRFGYFGGTEDLQSILENRNGYNDGKTARFRAYHGATWREALSYSPAEPGLSRALELPDGRISAGGWNDLHPVLALKNMGCDKVIYLTRRGEESRYAVGVSGLLGSQLSDEYALYDLSNVNSGFSRSLEETDGVSCTNWDQQERLNFPAFFSDAYNATMQTTDAYLQSAPNISLSANLGLRGCTVGVY